MVHYEFVPLTEAHLDAMETWTYDPRFFPDFDMAAYRDSLAAGAEPLTGPAGCDGYAVYDDALGLIGLFEYYFKDDGSAAIGLALAPELTGRGLGTDFMGAGIRFLVEHYDYRAPVVHLDVAETNLPAVGIYRRTGFVVVSGPDDDGELTMSAPIVGWTA